MSAVGIAVNFQCYYHYFCCSVIQSCPTLCDPVDAACQASLSFTVSQFAQTHVQSGMPCSHLILCYDYAAKISKQMARCKWKVKGRLPCLLTPKSCFLKALTLTILLCVPSEHV